MVQLSQTILKEFGWFINALLLLFLVYLTRNLFKGEPVALLRAFGREIREFFTGRFTVGAINFLGFIGLAIFGLVIIVLGEISQLVNFFIALVGRERTQSLFEDRSLVVFVFLGGFLVFSLMAVLAKDYLGKRTRK